MKTLPETPRYAIGVDVQADHAEAIASVTALLKERGFGILTTIDVQATLKVKLGLDVEPQTILGACNPKLAASALAEEGAMGVLLPCNVFVRQVAPGVNRVFLTRASALFDLVDNPAIAPVAATVDDVMQEIADILAA